MKNSLVSQLIKGAAFSLTILILTVNVCNAQEWSRRGKGEMFALGQFIGGDTTRAGGFPIKLDDAFSGGLGYGYNLNDHFNLNMDFSYGQSELKALGISADANLLIFDINVDFNVLKSRLTPLITGGAGYVRFHGDVRGFDFDETDFSYNVGGGLRWDVTDHFLLKAVYRSLWTKMKDTSDALQLNVVALSIGYIF